jgi:hypothetical protein
LGHIVSGRLFDPLSKLILIDRNGDCVALILKPGEIPKIRKIAALLRFHRLNAATASLQKDALPVLLVFECQALAVLTKAREFVDESGFFGPEMPADPGDLLAREGNVPGPTATGGTPLAFVKGGHNNFVLWP